MDYRRHNVELFRERGNLKGARVLEIGGDSRGDTARMILECGAREVVVTNVAHGIRNARIADNIELVCADARTLHESFPEGHFDAAFGVAVAEHIPDPAAWTNSLSKVMAPGGVAVVHGGPLWSGPHGHHVWVNVEGASYRFSDKSNPLDPWAHLLHDEASIVRYLVEDKGLPESHATAIAHWVYHDRNINRVSYSELVSAMGSHGMKMVDVVPNIYLRPDEAMQARLSKSPYGTSERYEVSGAAFVMQRN